MKLFSYFKNTASRQIFAKTRVTFAVYADDVEHIVARSDEAITSKKQLKGLISTFLYDNGANFDDDRISTYPVELAAAKENARVVVKALMPELYMGDK